MYKRQVTPDADKVNKNGLEKITITDEDLKETYEKLNTGEDPDIIIIGCPHASIREIRRIADKLQGKKVRKPLWICTSRVVRDLAEKIGLLDVIEKAGANIVADTCMVVAPIEKMGYKTTAVNSGKAANYLPGFCKQNVVFQNIDELVRRAMQ